MKFLTAAMATVLSLPIAALSAQPEFNVSARVKVDGTPMQAFSYAVQIGRVRILDLPFGALRVELAARESGGSNKQAYIRLLQREGTGSDYRVLHEAYLSDTSPETRNVSYLVCGEHTTFMSPAPAEMPQCAN
jgi:hypothetical protein